MTTEKDCEFIRRNFSALLKNTNPFKITGSCNRCGKCCYILDKRPELGGTRQPCEHLSFDSEGLAVCDIYETRPQECVDFPIVRNRTDESWFDDCGFTVTWNLSEETHDAIKELNIMCTQCTVPDKDLCQARVDAILQIIEDNMME